MNLIQTLINSYESLASTTIDGYGISNKDTLTAIHLNIANIIAENQATFDSLTFPIVESDLRNLARVVFQKFPFYSVEEHGPTYGRNTIDGLLKEDDPWEKDCKLPCVHFAYLMKILAQMQGYDLTILIAIMRNGGHPVVITEASGIFYKVSFDANKEPTITPAVLEKLGTFGRSGIEHYTNQNGVLIDFYNINLHCLQMLDLHFIGKLRMLRSKQCYDIP